ncbi:MAG TPA: hypothetical protein VK419_01190 [Bryobacteraceae bacterium]|nr:hypothetical protein [Bryobacteraceae bacterium]
MTLKQYVPISVAVLAVVVAGAMYFGVPALPFVLIILAGETLVGFQLEDGRVPRFLAELFHASSGPKTPQTH